MIVRNNVRRHLPPSSSSLLGVYFLSLGLIGTAFAMLR